MDIDRINLEDVQVWTSDDELGGIPDADANGDQTGGMGAL